MGGQGCIHLTFPSSVSVPPSHHLGKSVAAFPFSGATDLLSVPVATLPVNMSLRRDVFFLPKYGKVVEVPSA